MNSEPDPPEVAQIPDSQLFYWIGCSCLVLALFGAGYLAAVSLSGGAIAGCGPTSGCNHVLASRWAYWFGLPVSVPALVLYLALMASAITCGRSASLPSRAKAQAIIFGFGPIALGAALWFVLLQAFVLKSWCKICLGTHGFASLGIGFLLLKLSRNPSRMNCLELVSSRRFLGPSSTIFAFGMVILITGQLAATKRFFVVSALSGTSSSNGAQLVLHKGQFKLNPAELPRLGSATATNFIVSLFDYTCSHCRALHPLLTAAESKYSGQLAILSLPMPLDANCNPLILVTAPANENSCEYAKLALAVWRARSEAFNEFDNWMFSSDKPPALSQARAKAEALVGKHELETALADPWVKRQLEVDVSLYQANGRSIGDARLPQLVIGDVVIHGTMERLEDFTQLLEQHLPLSGLGVPHPSTPAAAQTP